MGRIFSIFSLDPGFPRPQLGEVAEIEVTREINRVNKAVWQDLSATLSHLILHHHSPPEWPSLHSSPSTQDVT